MFSGGSKGKIGTKRVNIIALFNPFQPSVAFNLETSHLIVQIIFHCTLQPPLKRRFLVSFLLISEVF